MPLLYVTYGQQIVDNLRNNTNIAEIDRVPLAKALCEKSDSIGMAKSIAKALRSPAQLDELLRMKTMKEIWDMAKSGAQRFQEAAQALQFLQLMPVRDEILSFLPPAARAGINRALRAQVNLERTGGLTAELHNHLVGIPRLDYGRDKPCIVCRGSDKHLPVLRESPRTRTLASRLARLIADAHKARRHVLRSDGNRGYRGYMLGVLTLEAEVYIAISGSLVPRDLESIFEGRGTFVDIATPHTTAGGARIDDVYLAQSDATSPAEPFMCAAPKLVAHVRDLKQEHQTWAMTEIWCGPNTAARREGLPYRSCSNCRDILPMMLCSRQPVAKQEGGFKLVLNTHKGKKDALAGRKNW